MTQEPGEEIQAVSELSEEQLDQIAAGNKDKWPDPPLAASPAIEPSILTL